MTRLDPPFQGNERDTLIAYLNYHRSTLTDKCDGLTPAQLAQRAVPPSELTLLGLVRHLAEVERRWFQHRVAALDVGPIYWSEADPDGDFHLPVTESDAQAQGLADEAFATWRVEIARSDEIMARAASLDQTFRDERHGDVSLRWLLVHMIEEYARHNGHADLLREAIDGATGE
jgi:hypothetical protein